MAICRIRVRGLVQGVGFRPYVWRLARELKLSGWVRNDGEGVEIEARGAAEAVRALLERLPREAPRLARIDAIEAVDASDADAAGGADHDPPPTGTPSVNPHGYWICGPSPQPGEGAQAADFVILESAAGAVATAIGPDAAVCPECIADLCDPANRRWRYAFTTCTHCGPRFTVSRGIPYDRARTSLAPFPLCPDCAAEYADPADRRFHAETTACPQCGPQLSLLDAAGRLLAGVPGAGTPLPEALPTGAGVVAASLEEEDPVAAALCLLRAGKILALKGLGGFHLTCDARNPAAVAALRARKHRDEKPFAVMALNPASLAEFAAIGEAESALLRSREAPIVLCPKGGAELPGIAPGLAWLGAMLPATPLHLLLWHEAAGRPAGTDWLAAPCDLLLVMTSANPHGEPLVIGNDEALARLSGGAPWPSSPAGAGETGREERCFPGIADAFLLHDRDIVVRCDDSVVAPGSRTAAELAAPAMPRLGREDAPETRMDTGSTGHAPSPGAAGASGREPEATPLQEPARASEGRPVPAREPPSGEGLSRFIRRARGYTPVPIPLAEECPPVLAFGAYLKNTVCVLKGRQAFLSQHIGGLDNAAAIAFLEETVAHLLDILEVEPAVVAHDLHPDYPATRLAAAFAARRGIPAVAVGHHHAHIAAILAEHGIGAAAPVLGLALDGVGLGPDGGAWGGELLQVDGARCERLGHLAPLRLPGGDRAAREPWRLAASALFACGRQDDIPAFVARRHPGRDGALLARLLARGFNCPPTSSLGRLFDAAAGLLGLRAESRYEGQAAMELEGLAARHGPVAPLAGGSLLLPIPENTRPGPPPETRMDAGSTGQWLERRASAGGAAPRAPLQRGGKLEERLGERGGVLDFSPLLSFLADCDDAPFGAALFHATVAAGLADWAGRAAGATGLNTVACGGGCAMNAVLMASLRGHLQARGLGLLEARRAPPNDGGLALGQAWVARRSL